MGRRDQNGLESAYLTRNGLLFVDNGVMDDPRREPRALLDLEWGFGKLVGGKSRWHAWPDGVVVVGDAKMKP